MRRTQREIPIIPQNTNLACGRGRGYTPCLGRNTFVDELIARVDSSTGARYRGPSSMRRILVSPRLEASVSTMEISVRPVILFGVLVEGTLGDKGIFVGAGGT